MNSLTFEEYIAWLDGYLHGAGVDEKIARVVLEKADWVEVDVPEVKKDLDDLRLHWFPNQWWSPLTAPSLPLPYPTCVSVTIPETPVNPRAAYTMDLCTCDLCKGYK